MRVKSTVRGLYYRHSLGKHFPILLFTFAFLVRVGLILMLKTYSTPYHFSEHVHIADRILEGKGYRYDWYGLGSPGEGSFMPPVYVGVVLMAKIAFPSIPWLAIQIFQAALSACTAVLVYFIGREILSELVGAVASFMLSVYPPALGYALDIQSLTVEAFLIACIVVACIFWQKNGTWKRSSVLGFALGLAVLSRSNLILLLPLLLFWMVLCHRRRGVTHIVLEDTKTSLSFMLSF